MVGESGSMDTVDRLCGAGHHAAAERDYGHLAVAAGAARLATGAILRSHPLAARPRGVRAGGPGGLGTREKLDDCGRSGCGNDGIHTLAEDRSSAATRGAFRVRGGANPPAPAPGGDD